MNQGAQNQKSDAGFKSLPVGKFFQELKNIDKKAESNLKIQNIGRAAERFLLDPNTAPAE